MSYNVIIGENISLINQMIHIIISKIFWKQIIYEENIILKNILFINMYIIFKCILF